MGKYKLRLWDMMPSAWFYKLKDTGGKARHTNSSSINTSSGSNSPSKKQPKPKPLPLPPTSHPSNPKQSSHSPYPRKSYYFTRELIPNDNNTLLNLPDPPRRSSKHRARRRASSPKLISSSGCSCRATLWTNNSKSDNCPLSRPDHEGAIIFPEGVESFEPFLFPPEFRSDGVLATQSFDQMLSFASKSCACKHDTDDGPSDTIIDVDKKSLAREPEKQLNAFDDVSQLDLPPIVTKQVTKSDGKKKEDTEEKLKDNSKELPLKIKRTRSAAANVVKVDQHKSSSNSPGGRRHYNYSANSPGIRLRINSPRIASRRSFHRHHQVQGRKSLSLSSSSGSSKSSSTSSSSRRSLSSSLAIVKSSFDPQKDFRESMVEMIVENNISASKDLEYLLACYLSLNSDVYHDLIIKVFKQIWFDLTHVD